MNCYKSSFECGFICRFVGSSVTPKSPDVLRDAPRLLSSDLALPQTVQQGGLTVVNVTHDGYHRRSVNQVSRIRRMSENSNSNKVYRPEEWTKLRMHYSVK